MRSTGIFLSYAVLSVLPVAALAQPVPGIRPIDPGGFFPLGGARGLLRGQDGRYHTGSIDLQATHDGSAVAFYIGDPAVPSEREEAKRFQAELKKCPHTHGFIVIPPARAVLPRMVAESLDNSGLELPVILDDHNVFSVAFRHDRTDSSLYELFDRSQVLVVENAAHLGQRLSTGETVGDLLKLLDQGKPVGPEVLPVPQKDRHPRM